MDDSWKEKYIAPPTPSGTGATMRDFSNALRDSGWYSKLKYKLISDFMCEKTESIKDLILLTDRLTPYEHLVIAATYYEFLESAGFEVVDSFRVYDDDIYPSQHLNVEVSPGEFKKGWDEGVLFLKRKKDGKKFVMEVSSSGYRYWDFEAIGKKGEDVETQKILNDMKEYAKKNNFLKNKKINPAFMHIKLDKAYTWDDIVLPAKLKKELKTNIGNLFSSIDAYKKVGIPFKRGLILGGVPGVGKTLIAKILCSSVDCSFVWVTPRFLQEAQDVTNIYSLVRDLAPTILFLEDIDLFGKNRDQTYNRSLLGELMNQLDGLQANEYVVTVATTNRIDDIEEALRNRPGRFDRIYEIPTPDDSQKLNLLNLYIDKGHCVHDLTKEELIAVSQLAKGFTGSHMKELVNTAIMLAIEAKSKKGEKFLIKRDHFASALKSVSAASEKSIGFENSPADADPDKITEARRELEGWDSPNIDL